MPSTEQSGAEQSGAEHAQNAQHGEANRLQQAEERLARAIGRLEGAFDAQAQTQLQPQTQPQPQTIGGARDGDPDPQLARELERLKAENAQLRALVGEAATRLDGAIEQLKSRMQT